MYVSSAGKTSPETGQHGLHLAKGGVSRVAGRSTLSLDEGSWENEGGNLAGGAPASRGHAYSVSEVEAFEGQVRSMETTLASDFAGGRIGQRYNTYEHRSRVLRQQQAKLDEMRGGLADGGQ